ncbi:MAG: hypothetical protein DMG93_21535, partial [Acidobacteria bacterium]
MVESSFVASTMAMREVEARIELLAKVDVPVLISGESGSGRETVARLIHQLRTDGSSRLRRCSPARPAARRHRCVAHTALGFARSAPGSDRSPISRTTHTRSAG